MKIDVHVHVGEVPEHIEVWWGQELYRPWKYVYGAGGHRAERKVIREPVKVDRLLRDMDEAGMDMACIMATDFRRNSPSPELKNPCVPNDYVAELARQYPDKLIPIAGIDPIRGISDAVNELDRCVKQLGMKGLKLYPTYNHFDPGDPLIYPLYEKAIDLDIPIHFHMGWTPSVNAPMKYQMPYLLDVVGIRYRELKVIVAHLGWPWWEECVCLLAKHQNFCADLAYWCTFPPEKTFRALLLCRDLVGLDRIVYGSEYALCNPASFSGMFARINDEAAKLNLPKLSDGEIKGILGENAARLFKIKKS